jgi:hypothetical protein
MFCAGTGACGMGGPGCIIGCGGAGMGAGGMG